MKRQLLLVLVFLMSLVAFGEDSPYILKDIDVTKNREVPVEVVKALMSSQVGDKFSTEKMVADYKRISKEEYIDEISIFPELYDGGIKLNVEVKEAEDAKEKLQAAGIVPLSEQYSVDKSLIVNHIEIFGNRYVSEEDILKEIPVKVGEFFSRGKVLEGQKNILRTGFFRDVMPEVYRDGDGVLVRYTLVENPVISGFKIYGNTVYSTEELLKLVETKPGEIFNINTLRADQKRIIDKYHNDGYILADILRLVPNENFELELHLIEGKVSGVQFRKMVTKQKGARRQPNDNVLKTKDYVMRRELEIEDGEVYNIKDYEATERNLTRLGHFKNVKVEYKDIPSDPNEKIVVILVDEERTASLQGAVSYGSEVGLLGSISLQDTNWKGKSQKIGVSFEQSDSDYSKFSINFNDPWIKDTNRISWGWSLYKTQYEDDDSFLFNEITTYGGKFQVGKGLTKDIRIGLGAKAEYVTEDDDDDNETDSYGQYSLYPSITYDTRNNPWNATSGNYARFQVEGGYAGGYDSGTFSNATLELRKYHRGFWKKNTFAYRFIGGIMSDGTKESQRFRVGGGKDLRGYDGSYYRGKQKLAFTLENRSQINDLLGVVLFVDAARAWKQEGRDPEYMDEGRDDEDIPNDFGIGAGFGVRLNTPVGPLRFDFGWPLGDSDESGLQFYFSMGQSF